MGIKINTGTTCGLCFFSAVSAKTSGESARETIGAGVGGYFMFGILIGIGLWGFGATKNQEPIVKSLNDVCGWGIGWPCLLCILLGCCNETSSERRLQQDQAPYP